MDNVQLHRIIQRLPRLREKYLGCFPPEFMINSLPINTFQIVRVEGGPNMGHFVVFINRNGVHYFGDASGTHIDDYFEFNDRYKRKVVHSTHKQLQSNDYMCAWWCIYFAHLAFHGLIKVKDINYNSMHRFVGAHMNL